jgi:hypothetical protein
VIVPEPLAAWPFDGDLLDATGHGHDLTPSSGPGFTTGFVYTQAWNSGEAASAALGGPSRTWATTPMAWVAWVGAPTGGSGDGGISNFTDGAARQLVLTFLWNPGLEVDVNLNGTFHSFTGLGSGPWFHLAITWDLAIVRFYVDGVQHSSFSGSPMNLFQWSTCVCDFSPEDLVQFSLSDYVLLVGDTLGPEDVALLFESGAPYPLSP